MITLIQGREYVVHNRIVSMRVYVNKTGGRGGEVIDMV